MVWETQRGIKSEATTGTTCGAAKNAATETTREMTSETVCGMTSEAASETALGTAPGVGESFRLRAELYA